MFRLWPKLALSSVQGCTLERIYHKLVDLQRNYERYLLYLQKNRPRIEVFSNAKAADLMCNE